MTLHQRDPEAAAPDVAREPDAEEPGAASDVAAPDAAFEPEAARRELAAERDHSLRLRAEFDLLQETGV